MELETYLILLTILGIGGVTGYLIGHALGRNYQIELERAAYFANHRASVYGRALDRLERAKRSQGEPDVLDAEVIGDRGRK